MGAGGGGTPTLQLHAHAGTVTPTGTRYTRSHTATRVPSQARRAPPPGLGASTRAQPPSPRSPQPLLVPQPRGDACARA